MKKKASSMDPEAGAFRPSFIPHPPAPVPSTKHHSPDAPTATRVVRENTGQSQRFKGAAERPRAPRTKQATQKSMNPYWQPRDNAGIAKRMKSDPKRNTEWLYISALKHVETVSNHLIEPTEGPVASAVSDFSVVCSYNWSGAYEPTIFVPGASAKYKKPSLPLKLESDHGIQYVDHNVYRNPVMPFEPMMRAASIMNPSANFDNVDIVISRGGLQRLLDFGKGKSQESFRVELNLVNNTLFVAWRKEKNSFRVSRLPEKESWGHAFEDAFKEYDAGLESSVSHHRVIQYNIGEMKCIVRHEVDGAYYGSDEAEENAPTNTEDGETPPSATRNATLTGKERISKETRAIQRGREAPPSSILELKARPRMEPWEAMNQMYFGRTPHLIIGQHEKGEFTNVRTEDCESMMETWEWWNHEPLNKLAYLLGSLRERVKKAIAEGKRAFAIYNTMWDKTALEIWTTLMRQAPIPQKLERMFWTPECNLSVRRYPHPTHGETHQRFGQGKKPWQQRKNN